MKGTIVGLGAFPEILVMVSEQDAGKRLAKIAVLVPGVSVRHREYFAVVDVG